jgi:hypothetical protein
MEDMKWLLASVSPECIEGYNFSVPAACFI